MIGTALIPMNARSIVALADQLRDHGLHRVRRDREADADVAVARLSPVSICELTPITSPRPFSSGPPELPWLIAASVWMTWSIV